MKIKKFHKAVCKLCGKKVAHIGTLKQALNHGLVSKKEHRVIKFNQKSWLNFITKLRREIKNDFEKDFF